MAERDTCCRRDAAVPSRVSVRTYEWHKREAQRAAIDARAALADARIEALKREILTVIERSRPARRRRIFG
jgi:hypothetical protein